MKRIGHTLIVLAVSVIFAALCTGSCLPDNNKFAIVIVTDRSDEGMMVRYNQLIDILDQIRNANDLQPRDLMIKIYYYDEDASKQYCEKVLGIYKSDLLCMGICPLSGPSSQAGMAIDKLSNIVKVLEDAKQIMHDVQPYQPKLEKINLSTGIDVQSTPPGAGVLVNGNALGTTPMNSPLAPGDYFIVVKLPGYTKYESHVQLKYGETRAINPQLSIYKIKVLIAVDTKDLEYYYQSTKMEISLERSKIEDDLRPKLAAMNVVEFTSDVNAANIAILFECAVGGHNSADAYVSGRIQVVDIVGGKSRRTLVDESKSVNMPAFSMNDNWAATVRAIGIFADYFPDVQAAINRYCQDNFEK